MSEESPDNKSPDSRPPERRPPTGGAPRGGPARNDSRRGSRSSRDSGRSRGRQLPAGPKLFAVAEADALIPFLERSLSELAVLRATLRTLRKDIEVLNLIAASAGVSGNPDAAELRDKRKRFRSVAAEIERINGALEESGCLVKHPDEGLVDFFHLRGDRLVFLCWKAGEERIRAWHPLSGGFATRQPLDHDTD